MFRSIAKYRYAVAVLLILIVTLSASGPIRPVPASNLQPAIPSLTTVSTTVLSSTTNTNSIIVASATTTTVSFLQTTSVTTVTQPTLITNTLSTTVIVTGPTSGTSTTVFVSPLSTSYSTSSTTSIVSERTVMVGMLRSDVSSVTTTATVTALSTTTDGTVVVTETDTFQSLLTVIQHRLTQLADDIYQALNIGVTQTPVGQEVHSVVVTAPPPALYYVTPLNRASGTYFYIYGAHFGLSPTIVSAPNSYSGKDTVFGSGPSVGIADLNQGWSAGGQYGSSVTVDGFKFTGYNQIGLVGLTWSDNEITLTGLGSALPAAGYHIHNGDTLLVAVFAPGGTVYALVHYTGPSF
jgi:hypothetical protein